MFTAVAGGRATIPSARIDDQVALRPGSRLAASALLCIAGILFLAPPLVGLLVIAGVVR